VILEVDILQAFTIF